MSEIIEGKVTSVHTFDVVHRTGGTSFLNLTLDNGRIVQLSQHNAYANQAEAERHFLGKQIRLEVK